VVLPRDSTKMWPLELTDTPDTSPRYMLAGSRSGLGTDSKAMLGTACCADAAEPLNNSNPISQCFMVASQDAFQDAFVVSLMRW